MKWLSLLNESPSLCVEWCCIELFPKKVWASAKISHFCKNRPKNSQILSFWWNGFHFWMKVHYCASNGAILNSFLKKSRPLQKSAIFAKISPKTARFWFFQSRMTILLTKSYVYYPKVVEIFVQNIFFWNVIISKIHEFHKISKPKKSKIRPGPTSFSFEPVSKPVGLPPPTNRCFTSIWGCEKSWAKNRAQT